MIHMMKHLPVLLLLCLPTIFLKAQSAQDATVPIVAEVDTAQLSITLTWPNSTASNITLKRRKKGDAGNQWIQLFSQTASTIQTYTDTNLQKGSTYEYSLRRVSNISAFGYAHVAMLENVPDDRGKILIFIDSTTAQATGEELEKFRNSLRGDAWQTVTIQTGPSSTVQSIKNRIVAEYTADPERVKAVLLIGEIPVPYSGNSAWDGHGDHAGAWPCDNYYADVDGSWTDVFVNNTTPGRDANDNVPGDGKFDQSTMPSPPELMVGRIDFRRLNASTFGATPTELIRRYFIKNLRWRMKEYTVEYKALVDDNFGYFSGEAFAANGYRNAYPLVGAPNIVAGDLLTQTDTNTYLLGYGCGGGSYTSASGVGNSSQVATDSINVVFSNIFGSYHGDWDYENNPLMPSFLASKGGILTCSWAGRPHWFMQALASGETIGYCTKETMSAQSNSEYIGTSSFGSSGAHVALLGDPTVRAHIVAPVPEFILVSTCGAVELSWKAAPDTGILGYNIYRSTAIDGPYVRQNESPVDALDWIDTDPVHDTAFYQVRPVRIDHAPGGGYFYNAGTGVIVRHVYTLEPPVLTPVVLHPIDCNNPEATLVAQVSPPFEGTIFWSGPGLSATGDTVTTTVPGIYTVTAVNTDECYTFTTLSVTENLTLPEITAASVTHVSVFGASDGAIDVETAAGSSYTYVWNTGATSRSLTGIMAGAYTVTITNTENGCIQTINFQVDQPSAVWDVSQISGLSLFPNPADREVFIRCENPDVRVLQAELFSSDGKLQERVVFKNTVQAFSLNLRSYSPGIYQVVVLTDGGRSVHKLVIGRL